MNVARIKSVLIAAETGGMIGLKAYFDQPDLIVTPKTWVSNIKQMIQNGQEQSAFAEIELMLIEFKLLNNGFGT